MYGTSACSVHPERSDGSNDLRRPSEPNQAEAVDTGLLQVAEAPKCHATHRLKMIGALMQVEESVL